MSEFKPRYKLLDSTITFRLGRQEKAIAQAHAREQRLSLGNYLRHLIEQDDSRRAAANVLPADEDTPYPLLPAETGPHPTSCAHLGPRVRGTDLCYSCWIATPAGQEHKRVFHATFKREQEAGLRQPRRSH